MIMVSFGKRFRDVGKSLLVLVASWHGTAMAQKIPSICPCYSIQVDPSEQTVRIGNPARINVEVTNTVDHDIYVEQDSRNPGALYFVDVKDSSGVRQKMTDAYSETTSLLHAKEAGLPNNSGLFIGEDGKVHLRTYRGSNEPLLIVKPGQKVSVSILLNDLYRLDKVGTYTVQIKKIEGKEEMVSNVVIVGIAN
jgi:hypothetical protein